MRCFLSVLMALAIVPLTPRSHAEFKTSPGHLRLANAATIIHHDIICEREGIDSEEEWHHRERRYTATLSILERLDGLKQSSAPAREIDAEEEGLKPLLESMLLDWASAHSRAPYQRHLLADPQQQLRDLIGYYVYWSMGALLVIGLGFTAVDVLRNCHLPLAYELHSDLVNGLIDEATFRAEMRAHRRRLPIHILIRFGTGFIPDVLVRWYSWLRVP